MQRAFIFLFSVFFLHHANAQYEEKDFVLYTVKEGLSENYVTSLVQDDWGYLWIGTDIGLNRFDGHSFKNFYQGTKTLPLLSSIITRLKPMGPHRVGIINHGGFQVLNTKEFTLKNYSVPDSTAFSVYRNAAADAVQLTGNSFAVTTASGFYEFDAAGKLMFRHDAYQLKDVGNKRILFGREIYPLNDDTSLIFINGTGVAYYDRGKKLFFEISKGQQGTNVLQSVALTNNVGWTARYQINADEFIFIQFPLSQVIYYNNATGKTVISSFELPPFEFTWESKITMLNDTSLLVNAGYSGFYIFHFDKITGKITINPKKYLASHKIQCLYVDKERRLWAGTSKGLLQQRLNKPVLHPVFYEPSPTDSVKVGLSCAFRYTDKLYLGRFSLNKGLVISDTAAGSEQTQIDFYGKNTRWNEIRSIQMYHPDTLWIGTNAGLLWFAIKTWQYGKLTDNKKYAGLPQLDVLAAPREDGYAWMCSHLGGVVARYHITSRTFTLFTSKSQPALPFNKVKHITYDSYGDVWIGGHSLARWNNQKQNFDTLISVYGGPNRFEEDILTMNADNAGSLWMHNAVNGLLEYRIKEKKFISYTMADGLPSDVFYAFSPVINNQLWMSGHNELSVFDTRTKKISVYDHRDGFPEDKPTSRNLYYDAADKKLYLFNQHVLSTIKLPQNLTVRDRSDIIIEELTINNQNHLFFPRDGLRFKPGENNLTLHFAVIHFEPNNTYQFAYRFDKNASWTDLADQRSINLTGLAPDFYTIWIKASSKSGLQQVKEFSFTINPPFWKTTGFLLVIGFLAGATLYFLYRKRINQVRERANIDRLLAQAEMKALHAQMNPHFIFNCLNGIREMILTNENKEASHFLSKFAHLIRMTLDQSGQAFISLRNAMEYLTRYIEMEQIRNSHFTFRILADEQLDPDETVLPPMLIQPFVENAIWHGTQGTNKNININIDFKKENQQLICIIEDNGIGINASLKNNSGAKNHHSVGIENVRNRIRLLNEKYQQQSRIRIEDKNDLPGYSSSGTVVILHLPLEINEE